MYSSITPRRMLPILSFWVVTFMPSATGVVQEAGKPFMPSTCTRHMRQEPKASSRSVAHSLGIDMPASAAARSTEVPAGTVTSRPSMLRLTCLTDWLLGVPKSRSAIDCIVSLTLNASPPEARQELKNLPENDPAPTVPDKESDRRARTTIH